MNVKGDIVLCLYNEIDTVLKYVQQPRMCNQLLKKEQEKPESTQEYKYSLASERSRCTSDLVENRLERFYVLFPIMDRLARQLSGEVADRVYPVINDVYRLQEKWDRYYSELYGVALQN